MDIRLSQCFIAVDDHDKALAFYRGALGLEVRNDVGFEGMRWVTVGAPSQPDVDIVSRTASRGPERLALRQEGHGGVAGEGPAGRRHLHDRRLRRHVRAHQRRGRGRCCRSRSTSRTAWRDCAFRDPSGNMLRFSQPRKQ
ncbi:VOC family protein [Nonomuraea dietziae]|uniref:VOC family protein n=1 Tax=Nonomuraea dietziae TaxID=65515 RepID=UPI0031D32179